MLPRRMTTSNVARTPPQPLGVVRGLGEVRAGRHCRTCLTLPEQLPELWMTPLTASGDPRNPGGYRPGPLGVHLTLVTDVGRMEGKRGDAEQGRACWALRKSSQCPVETERQPRVLSVFHRGEGLSPGLCAP